MVFFGVEPLDEVGIRYLSFKLRYIVILIPPPARSLLLECLDHSLICIYGRFLGGWQSSVQLFLSFHPMFVGWSKNICG